MIVTTSLLAIISVPLREADSRPKKPAVDVLPIITHILEQRPKGAVQILKLKVSRNRIHLHWRAFRRLDVGPLRTQLIRSLPEHYHWITPTPRFSKQGYAEVVLKGDWRPRHSDRKFLDEIRTFWRSIW